MNKLLLYNSRSGEINFFPERLRTPLLFTKKWTSIAALDPERILWYNANSGEMKITKLPGRTVETIFTKKMEPGFTCVTPAGRNRVLWYNSNRAGERVLMTNATDFTPLENAPWFSKGWTNIVTLADPGGKLNINMLVYNAGDTAVQPGEDTAGPGQVSIINNSDFHALNPLTEISFMKNTRPGGAPVDTNRTWTSVAALDNRSLLWYDSKSKAGADGLKPNTIVTNNTNFSLINDRPVLDKGWTVITALFK